MREGFVGKEQCRYHKKGIENKVRHRCIGGARAWVSVGRRQGSEGELASRHSLSVQVHSCEDCAIAFAAFTARIRQIRSAVEEALGKKL